jgi:UDP-N-acetylmuramoyl-L-alanyl-D-glutamate--2,6-diaminopimelate ligase
MDNVVIIPYIVIKVKYIYGPEISHNVRMLDKALSHIRRYMPRKLHSFLNPAYHWTLALSGALIYRFPSRKMKVIAVTGTKGKSSTVEILSAILEEAGYATALSNTIRFKVGKESTENLYKMSMPGRFFLQGLIRRAVDSKCDYLVMEMTSQGALMHRHRFIQLDAFVFTNISPEHIEAHGSYERYLDAKMELCRALSRSKKPDRALIVNADDKESEIFLTCEADRKITYGLKDAEPYEIKKEGIQFTYGGRTVHSPLSGQFNLYNILAAAAAARSQGVSHDIIIRAVEKFGGIAGRLQKIEKGQDFKVIVDYAHTPDSLEKVYQVFQSSRLICVLGGTGGGRDTWKRKEMGRLADEYCDEVILTDEDPYDEDPKKIVDDVAAGVSSQQPSIIMDRRAAIREAITHARTGDAVLITGKGTDPYIMGPRDTKTVWSDARVATEELEAILKSR